MSGVFSNTARAIRSGVTRLVIGAISDGQVLKRVGATIVGAAAGPVDADVVHKTGDETIAGVKTFTSDPVIPDEAYGVGWNGSLEPPTKNAVYDKVETLGGGGASYLVYTALLTQTGTDAPVATVLENTLGGTVVWTRAETGIYTGTLSGAFPASKTALFITFRQNKMYEFTRETDNSVGLVSFAVDISTPEQVTADAVLSATSIEIRVYP